MATKAELQADLKKIETQLKSGELPPNVRSSLEAAQTNIKSMLEKEEFTTSAAPKGPKPAIKTKSGKGKPDLKDCQEIIKKYKQHQKKGVQRLAQRRSEGKPPALTIPETVKKAATAVKKKVAQKKEDDKPLTAQERDAAVTQVVALVKGLLQGLTTLKEKRKFVDDFMDRLAGALHVYLKEFGKEAQKAEEGLRMKGSQMRIFHYHTENFDQSPEAIAYFKRVLENEPIAERHKALVVSMAKDVDQLLGKIKEIGLTDAFDKATFIRSGGYAIRAAYWAYGIVAAMGFSDEDPQNMYPGFLAEDMYLIANHTEKTDHRPASSARSDGESGSEIVTIKISDSLGELENGGKIDISIKDKKLVIDMSAYRNVQEAIIEDIRQSFDSQPIEAIEQYTSQKYNRHIQWDGDFTEEEKRRVINQLVLDTMSKAAGRPGLYREAGGESNMRFSENLPSEQGDEVIQRLEPEDLEMINRQMANDEYATDEEMVEYFIDEGISKEDAQHIVKKYRNKFLRYQFFHLVHRKGGKVGFEDKVDAIAKNLEGKPVPKKYQKKAGKKYTKKTAKEAAQRIAGSMEQTKKEHGKARKMLLGGVALHTPAALSMGGDQNNLDIHGA